MQWETMEGYDQRSDVIQFVLRKLSGCWGENEQGRETRTKQGAQLGCYCRVQVRGDGVWAKVQTVETHRMHNLRYILEEEQTELGEGGDSGSGTEESAMSLRALAWHLGAWAHVLG